ncbi:phage antirepressor [Pseudomonas sp. Q1-7]|uniref:phage antirepressor n=1 Tax=Pseudomonas sp. Q1-7 TaxID=3020843 RepID=UPI002301AF46|nr:phage antirepressor [Pseudomonas sp. Q1-7]
MSHDYYVPSVFHRHHRAFRALLIDDQVWVVARDLGPLTNRHFDEHLPRKLDPDQWRRERLENHQGDVEWELLISESAVCELLKVNFYHPENRGLRQWFTGEVVPALRSAASPHLPRQRRVEWRGKEYSLMEWQGRQWVRVADVAELFEGKTP